jgi:DNA topoisomerase I
LYDRGYVKEKSIEATPLGISLIETLEKYSPIIIDEELTRNFEKEVDDIVDSTSNFEEKEKKVVDEAKETIIKISKDFEKNKKSIGNELITAESKQWEKDKEENKLNVCPVCKQGILSITYSRKTRRSFIACNAYPNCKKTYSLPPNGLIKKTDKLCEHCGFPMLMSLRKGKKPWIFCFNSDCESNKQRLEEYRTKKAQEENQSQENNSENSEE